MQDYSHLVPGLSLPSMNATNMVTHPESQAVALTGTGSTSVLPLPDAMDRTPLPDMSDAHDLPVNTMKPRLEGGRHEVHRDMGRGQAGGVPGAL